MAQQARLQLLRDKPAKKQQQLGSILCPAGTCGRAASKAYLGKRHAQGIGHEEEGEQEATNVEAGSQPELVAVVQVIEPHRGPQGAQLGHSSAEAVRRRADVGGVQLTCREHSRLARGDGIEWRQQASSIAVKTAGCICRQAAS